MWNRAKNILNHFVSLILTLVLIALCSAYVCINGFIMTAVINNLRMDTYIGFETGFSVVMLILLLGWVPVWLIDNFRQRPRITGRL